MRARPASSVLRLEWGWPGHVLNRLNYSIFSSMFVEPIELEVVLRDNEIDHMETLTSLELVK